MIEEYKIDSPMTREALTGMAEVRATAAVQLSVARLENGLYRVELGHMSTSPARLRGLCLGCVADVPPGQRRATWLLTDAVNLALTNPEAHSLLHW